MGKRRGGKTLKRKIKQKSIPSAWKEIKMVEDQTKGESERERERENAFSRIDFLPEIQSGRKRIQRIFFVGNRKRKEKKRKEVEIW